MLDGIQLILKSRDLRAWQPGAFSVVSVNHIGPWLCWAPLGAGQKGAKDREAGCQLVGESSKGDHDKQTLHLHLPELMQVRLSGFSRWWYSDVSAADHAIDVCRAKL